MVTVANAQCPHCREVFDPDYALLSAGLVVLTTQAASQANFLKSLNPGVVLILAVSAGAYASGWLPFLLASMSIPLLAVVAILRWHRRFGRYPISDDWYHQVRSDLRTSLTAWSVLLSVQFLVVALWSFASPPN